MGSLQGRVALVTGAGRRRGIGCAIAAELAFVAQRVASFGGRVVTVEADLTDRTAVAAMADEVRVALGVADILVNNAGIAGSAGLHNLLELDDEVWYQTVDANLNAVYLVTKALLGGMVASGRGTIINIGSIAARTGQPRMGAYCATKFALIGLTQQLALEFAPTIRVNCVCPGSTDTEMMDGTFARRDELAGAAHGTAKAARIASLPLARQGQPHDIAAAVAFLASDDAAWITGQTINVDGGQRMD